MANIKSQIKRNKQNEKARRRNKAVKSSLKTAVRGFREAADAGDTEKATRGPPRRLRQARQGREQGHHPQNQAANRKSALAKRIGTLKQG